MEIHWPIVKQKNANPTHPMYKERESKPDTETNFEKKKKKEKILIPIMYTFLDNPGTFW